jgi:hypothetical protein
MAEQMSSALVSSSPLRPGLVLGTIASREEKHEAG